MPTAARRCGRPPRGPKNVSLEQCDLGKGPGKVDGAFAELPRYFADADRVMDVETRILWCMEKLQGFNRADLVKRPHPGGGQPVKDLGAIATYVASKSSGHEIRRQARRSRRRRKRSRSARRCSFAAPARSISPARPATPIPACASGCRACRISPSPKEAQQGVGEWPAYRVSTTHVMTMQHRLYDCYWQMRMPELQLGSDVSVALIAYLAKTGRGRRDRRSRPQALSGETIMRNIALAHRSPLARAPRRRWRSRSPPSIRPRPTPRSRPAFPTAPADWAPRLDAATRRCSSARRTGTARRRPSPRRSRSARRRRSTIRADGNFIGDWKKGEALAQSGYGLRFTDYPARAGQRRQLLCLPSADQEGSELRHARPEPARIRQAAQLQRGRHKAAYEKIYNSHAAFPCSNMPRFGANKVLTIEQIKDAGRAADEPGQPGQLPG